MESSNSKQHEDIWLQQQYTIIKLQSLIARRDSLLLAAMNTSLGTELGKQTAFNLLTEARATTEVIKVLNPNHKERTES